MYSLSLQKKGNCTTTKKHNQQVHQDNQSTIICTKRNAPYLAHPLNHHCPGCVAFLKSFSVHEHIIPFRSEFVVPEEIFQHFRGGIFINSSTTILWRSSLWAENATIITPKSPYAASIHDQNEIDIYLKISSPSLVAHIGSGPIHHLDPNRPTIFLLNKLVKMLEIILIHSTRFLSLQPWWTNHIHKNQLIKE